ncbi:superfamily II DNA or RNA helicase [Bacillus oleivorans]|uniref:Superfamily II DNA or RNA helicase n=1 Tax=Bacillus oleivorans TaxID=1448271 RepID=A0A285D8N0_9BACI|nr:DEAD/DEAH box helicase family protein [Bacillus oleivorans]SNX75543.1 superfamily II DNA or RNA helicase [Bacillus oleivorans]
MTFRSLDLKIIYDNATDHIFEDLFNPLLSHATSYKRGVGYFTSSWLELCTNGLLKMAEEQGKIILVTSPHIEERDWDAFRIGSEAKQNDILYQSLALQVEEMKKRMESFRLTLLAWLIADGLLEIKIAVPKNNRGNFHDKFAIFEDSNGDKVALHGSLNDSEQASFNGEGVSVFCSWIEGQQGFVEGHETRFNQSFLQESNFYNVYELPKAIKMDIVQMKENTVRPYQLPVPKRQLQIKLPENITLRDFQQEAIEKWFENHGRGLFEMATGTGKTITSLAAASRFVNEHKTSVVLITVPFNHLVDQWESEVRMFGFNPIVRQGISSAWRSQLRTKIFEVNKGLRTNLCIITTHATGSTDEFLKLMEQVKVPLLYIADESHYLGAKKLGKLLHPHFPYRIGLSATPDRWFDEEGSSKLREYFEPTVIELPITEAVEKGFLTPYRFFPKTVALTDAEYEQFQSYTRKIINTQNDKNLSPSERRDKVHQLLIARSRIVNNAEEKLMLLKSILEEKIEKEGIETIKHTLVYSPQGKTGEIVKMLAELGIRAHEFIYTVSNQKKMELLDQFADGEIQVLVAMKCLDEGVNIPATKEAYFLASTTNPREFVQRRGRILRKYRDKKEAIIYDFYAMPPSSHLGEDAAVGLLKREIPRFAEFAEGSLNKFEAREVILPILGAFNLRNIIDLKPWDAYKMMQNEEGSDMNGEYED